MLVAAVLSVLVGFVVAVFAFVLEAPPARGRTAARALTARQRIARRAPVDVALVAGTAPSHAAPLAAPPPVSRGPSRPEPITEPARSVVRRRRDRVGRQFRPTTAALRIE